jgi:hypothetical protein
MRNFKVFVLLIFFSLLTVYTITDAGPTVIRDNRVRDLSVTPVLGRGYTISTNTFQSTCLKDVKRTKPSYDFTYNFQELQSLDTGITMDTSKLIEAAPKELIDYIDKKVEESKIEKISVETKTTTTTTKEEKKLHRILVTINLFSYYSSVDEANTKVSDSASQLLSSKDIPGFFNSCGSFYVRSITRKASFFSLFEFEYTTIDEAKEFVHQLETQLKGFQKLTEEEGKEEKVETEKKSREEIEKSFKSRAEKYNLTITTMAWGLGKDEKATLISYDVESFKNAIKDAFISMMDEGTGKVDSIEVVPWVENTEFQILIGLDKEDQEPARLESGTRVPRKPLLLYEKKQILNLNAEFLAEIERNNRNFTNLYYKARICKQHIDQNWKDFNPASKKLEFKEDFTKRYVRNNRGGKPILLNDLDTYLSKGYIDGLLVKQKKFMYGGDEWGKGARECINQIIGEGIFRVPYHDLESCRKLSEQMGEGEHDILESYCMPILYPNWFKVK